MKKYLTSLLLPSILLLATCAAILLPAKQAQAIELGIADIWVRPSPRNASVAAVYFTLSNNTKEPIGIQRFESDFAAVTELHETIIANGVVSMKPMGRIIIPPQTDVQFLPGKMHLMLMGLKGPLEKDAIVPLRLQLDNGEWVLFAAEVKDQPKK